MKLIPKILFAAVLSVKSFVNRHHRPLSDKHNRRILCVTSPPRVAKHTNGHSIIPICSCAKGHACHQSPPLSAKDKSWTDDTRGHTGEMTTQGCTPPGILHLTSQNSNSVNSPCGFPGDSGQLLLIAARPYSYFTSITETEIFVCDNHILFFFNYRDLYFKG